MKTLRLLMLLSLACIMSVQAEAQPVTVFKNPYNGVPVRIPALAVTKSGRLLSLVDYRHNWSDIGWKNKGTYRLDILMRSSDDGGKTWGPVSTVVQGNDNYGYGDPSVVADRDDDNLILVHSVGGNVPYVRATADNPQHAWFFRSDDGGRTWDKGHDAASQIYSLYKNAQPESQKRGLFLTSGKITQSRFIKVGKYYRLYIAHPMLNIDVFVLYSDDFGDTWHVLGGAAKAPCPDGDESKVEELPDGNVLLSCRKFSSNGRRFNVFVYDDKEKATGTWGTATDAEAMDSCTRVNGDIVVVPAMRSVDNHPVWLAIQSLPQSPNRDHLGFYYREIPAKVTVATAASLREGWKKGRMIHTGTSAYSSMTLLPDNSVGILYEANLNDGGYDILYSHFSVCDITNGYYTGR